MKNTHNSLLTSKYDTPMGTSQERFLLRNHVAPTFKGPVFVVEDVWVPCSLCRAPVDPVVRVPVGHMMFHPQCLRCALCKMPSRTTVFHAVQGQPVCADCIARGFDRTLTKSNVKQLINSNSSDGWRTPSRIGASRAGSRGPAIGDGNLTPRRAISPAHSVLAISPSPSSRQSAHRIPATPFLDSRGITKRQQELMEKQRILSEGDRNILLLLPPESNTTSTGGPDGYSSMIPTRGGGGTQLPAITLPSAHH